jgi:Branched-chain amino acid aminotransferase/4-amino-4-deoxychorismate lyase
MSSETLYIQACTNGRLHDACEPSIAPINRGFLYGDAIYEVWRTYEGVLFAWQEHWERLERSAAALHLALPLGPKEALSEIRRTVAAYRERTGAAGEFYVRLQITRGGGAIGLDPALADRSDYVLLVKTNPDLTIEAANEGMRLSIATSLRRNPIGSLNPAWKTGNYLNNLLCLREARSRGAEEVVMLNQAGEIAEAAVMNIAFVRDGDVVTPPMSAGILGGTTRKILMEKVAPSAGVQMREEAIRPEQLKEMDECFLLSTTKDLAPVASIDGHRFKLGGETVTMRLKRAFEAYAKEYARTKPELRV